MGGSNAHASRRCNHAGPFGSQALPSPRCTPAMRLVKFCFMHGLRLIPFEGKWCILVYLSPLLLLLQLLPHGCRNCSPWAGTCHGSGRGVPAAARPASNVLPFLSLAGSIGFCSFPCLFKAWEEAWMSVLKTFTLPSLTIIPVPFNLHVWLGEDFLSTQETDCVNTRIAEETEF